MYKRKISTEKFANCLADEFTFSRGNANLVEFVKNHLEYHGSPVVDELAEECVDALQYFTRKELNKHWMAKSAFTETMTKWFGEDLTIISDSYIPGELIKVSDNSNQLSKATGGKCPVCDGPKVYGVNGEPECGKLCGWSMSVELESFSESTESNDADETVERGF